MGIISPTFTFLQLEVKFQRDSDETAFEVIEKLMVGDRSN
jgi:hypothetical protein